MMIHFVGLEHLDKPGVLLFPKIKVCLDCGLSRFRLGSFSVSNIENACREGRRAMSIPLLFKASHHQSHTEIAGDNNPCHQHLSESTLTDDEIAITPCAGNY
jgi:hypothetical protein